MHFQYTPINKWDTADQARFRRWIALNHYGAERYLTSLLAVTSTRRLLLLTHHPRLAITARNRLGGRALVVHAATGAVVFTQADDDRYKNYLDKAGVLTGRRPVPRPSSNQATKRLGYWCTQQQLEGRDEPPAEPEYLEALPQPPGEFWTFHGQRQDEWWGACFLEGLVRTIAGTIWGGSQLPTVEWHPDWHQASREYRRKKAVLFRQKRERTNREPIRHERELRIFKLEERHPAEDNPLNPYTKEDYRKAREKALAQMRSRERNDGYRGRRPPAPSDQSNISGDTDRAD